MTDWRERFEGSMEQEMEAAVAAEYAAERTPFAARHSMDSPELDMAAIAARFWAKVDTSGGCWHWKAFIVPTGYGMFRMYGKRGKCERAHRAAWILTHGPIPDRLCVLHKCDNRRCVRPDHLFLGTHQDNMADRTQKGRHNMGAAREQIAIANHQRYVARVVAAGGNPDTDKFCCACHRILHRDKFSKGRGPLGRHGYCRECRLVPAGGVR